VKTSVPTSTTKSVIDKQPFPGQQGQSLWQTLRRILSIALYELLQQLRSITFWILIGICTIITGLVVYSSGQNQPAVIAFITIAGTAGRYSLILVPFLLFNIFQRDFRYKMRPMIWTRPVASAHYALGKGVAAIFLSVLALFFPLVLSWLLSDLHFGEIVLLDPFIRLFPMMVACNLCLALFTLIWIALLPKNALPGVILGCAVAVLLTGFISQPPLSLLNMNKGLFFYSFSIGFGPDSPLLVDQAFFMLALALICLGIVIIIYQYTEKQGAPRLHSLLGALLLILLAGSGAVSVARNFQFLTANYQGAVPAPVTPANATVSHYSLAVTADPDAGTLQGTATFTLTPGVSDLQTIAFLLNPGLQVRQVTITGGGAIHNPLSFHSAQGWTSLDLHTATLIQGQAEQLSVTYAGRLVIGRDNYAGINGMNDVLGANLNTYNPNPAQSYLGQGLGMLGGADEGNWYPLPWTRELVNNPGIRLSVENIHVRVPASTHIFSNVATPSTISGGQEITFQSDTALPTTFLALIDQPEQVTFPNATLIYQGNTPERKDLGAYHILLQQLQTMGALFNPTPVTHWQAIVLPFLQAPLVTPGLAWLPEYPLFDNTGLNMQSTDVSTGLAAQEIALAWWTNALAQNIQINVSSPTAQQPSGSLSIQTLYHYPVDITLLLSYYAAIVTANQSIGHDMQQQMFTLCQSYTSTTDQELEKRNTLVTQMMQYGFGSCRLQDLALFHLEQSYGKTRVERFIQQLASTNINQPLTAARFMKQASEFFHHDVTSLLSPDLCLSTPRTSFLMESFGAPMIARGGSPQACSSSTGGGTTA
jgi:hypothetical protein